MVDYAQMLPPMLVGEELKKSMSVEPDYSSDIRHLSASERITKLNDIYKVFVPTNMSAEIYTRLYLTTNIGLQAKSGIQSIQQMNANYQYANNPQPFFHGCICGASSQVISGISGIGKSSSLTHSIAKLGGIIEVDEPFHRIIPVLEVQTPFNSNPKDLLCAIVIRIDSILGTNYYDKVNRSNQTTPKIINFCSELLHLFCGVLLVDEIQHLVENRAGKSVYMMLMQLINTSQVPTIMIGTPECCDFFAQTPQMSRRSLGLQYDYMEFDSDFRNICKTLFSYQYVRNESFITENIMAWLYDHANTPAILTALIHDAQEIAIINGTESLDICSLNRAFSTRMSILNKSKNKVNTQPKLPQVTNIRKDLQEVLTQPTEISMYLMSKRTIASMVSEAKKTQCNIIDLFRQEFDVEEI